MKAMSGRLAAVTKRACAAKVLYDARRTAGSAWGPPERLYSLSHSSACTRTRRELEEPKKPVTSLRSFRCSASKGCRKAVLARSLRRMNAEECSSAR